jgi:glutaminase
MLRAGGVVSGSVDDVLETYFTLCSFEASVREPARFAAILARGGTTADGTRVLSQRTAACVVSLMATCGMYDESGSYLVATGLPAKSGVSGVIVAVAPGQAGLAVSSPRVNEKGGSVRGHAILRSVAQRLEWHFALPGVGR